MYVPRNSWLETNIRFAINLLVLKIQDAKIDNAVNDRVNAFDCLYCSQGLASWSYDKRVLEHAHCTKHVREYSAPHIPKICDCGALRNWPMGPAWVINSSWGLLKQWA